MTAAALAWLGEQCELVLSAREKMRCDPHAALTDAERAALRRWHNGIVANSHMFSIKTDTKEKPMRWYPYPQGQPGPLDGEEHP